MSEEQKAKISASSIGKVSPKKGKPGKPATAEQNKARSEKLKGIPKPKVVCRVVDRVEMSANHWSRWINKTNGT